MDAEAGRRPARKGGREGLRGRLAFRQKGAAVRKGSITTRPFILDVSRENGLTARDVDLLDLCKRG